MKPEQAFNAQTLFFIKAILMAVFNTTKLSNIYYIYKKIKMYENPTRAGNQSKSHDSIDSSDSGD